MAATRKEVKDAKAKAIEVAQKFEMALKAARTVRDKCAIAEVATKCFAKATAVYLGQL